MGKQSRRTRIKRAVKGKRGISSYIAVLLLVGLTVVIASSVQLWTSNFSSTLQSNVEQQYDESVECSSDVVLRVKSAEYVQSAVTATVENLGAKNVTGLTVRIKGVSGTQTVEVETLLKGFEIIPVVIPYEKGVTGNVQEIEVFPKVGVADKRHVCTTAVVKEVSCKAVAFGGSCYDRNYTVITLPSSGGSSTGSSSGSSGGGGGGGSGGSSGAAGETPSSNTTVPPTNETIPPSNETIPPTNETVPPSNETVPPSNESNGTVQILTRLEVTNFQVVSNYNKNYSVYNGVPTHYFVSWPFEVQAEVWRVNALNNSRMQKLTINSSLDVFSFQIRKCSTLTGNCTEAPIGNLNRCTDGIVKAYANLTLPNWTSYTDDSYRNCSSANQVVLTTQKPNVVKNAAHVKFTNLAMTGIGRYELCVQHTNSTANVSTFPGCMTFVSEGVNISLRNVKENYSFGEHLSFSPSNVGLASSDETIPGRYLNKLCQLKTDNRKFVRNVQAEKNLTVAIVRYPSSGSRIITVGTEIGMKKNTKGTYGVNISLTLPVSCRVDGRNGSHAYDVYHSQCSWYRNVGYQDTMCCENKAWKNGTCATQLGEEVSLQGDLGGSVLVKARINGTNNYDVVRVNANCEPGTFGNIAMPYSISTSTSNFWVNNMNYSLERSFSEPFIPGSVESFAANYSCDNLVLNFCGNAFPFMQLDHRPTMVGSAYPPDGKYICVGGSSCAHAAC